jgi:hypothetical protein
MKKYALYIFVFLVLISVIWLILSGQHKVKVTLTNQTNETLHNSSLAYTGGELKLDTLAGQESHVFQIMPTSETDLTLRYFDSSGIEHSKLIDVYIEPGYQGSLVIYINSDNVQWVSNINP